MTSRLLRAQVAALLPDGAFLRVDRTGRALYVTRSDADCAPLTARGWRCVPSGSVTHISPGLPQLEALRAPDIECPFGAQRFSALPADETILPLFTALLAACALPTTDAQRRRLEKQLRHRMAVALRTRSGGGLEVCAALLAACGGNRQSGDPSSCVLD